MQHKKKGKKENRYNSFLLENLKTNTPNVLNLKKPQLSLKKIN
jgi:hypothetical protein